MLVGSPLRMSSLVRNNAMEGAGDSLSIKEGEDVVGFKVRAALIQKQVNIGRVWSGRFGSHRERLKDGLDWTSPVSGIDWTSPQIIRMRRGEVDMEKERCTVS